MPQTKIAENSSSGKYITESKKSAVKDSYLPKEARDKFTITTDKDGKIVVKIRK